MIIYEKSFKRSSWHSLYIMLVMIVSYIIIFLVVFGINVIMNPDIEFILFSSGDISDEQITGLVTPFSEELFFRGFLISCFISASYKTKHFHFKIGRYQISLISIMGVIVSAILFARVHTLYYDDPLKMQGLIISGLVFGFYFMLWRDLSACVLSHFLMNVLAIGNIILTILTVLSYAVYFSIVYLYYDVLKKPTERDTTEIGKNKSSTEDKINEKTKEN